MALALVIQPEVLRIPRELLGNVRPLAIVLLAVPEDVSKLDPPVSAHLAERDFTLFEELDKERPRDIEEVGGLLRGQLLGHRNERHRLPGCKPFERGHEELERLSWHDDRAGAVCGELD